MWEWATDRLRLWLRASTWPFICFLFGKPLHTFFASNRDLSTVGCPQTSRQLRLSAPVVVWHFVIIISIISTHHIMVAPLSLGGIRLFSSLLGCVYACVRVATVAFALDLFYFLFHFPIRLVHSHVANGQRFLLLLINWQKSWATRSPHRRRLGMEI